MMIAWGLLGYLIVGAFAAWLDITDRRVSPLQFFGLGVISMLPLLFLAVGRFL